MTEILGNIGFVIMVAGLFGVPYMWYLYFFKYEYKSMSDSEFRQQMERNARKQGAKKAHLDKRAEA